MGATAAGAGVIDSAGAIWARLPAEIALLFVPHVERMTSCILADIQHAVPEYSQTAGAIEGRIARAVQATIARCIAHVAPDLAGLPTADDLSAVLRGLGRREFRAGRSTDMLQTAYRVGGRAAWRYFATVAQQAQLRPDLLCHTAEAIFATVDDVSAITMAGYTDEKLQVSGMTQRHRARLLAVLLTDPPASPAAIAELAAAASWTVPERAAAVAITPAADGGALDLSLDEAVLCDLHGPQAALVTADPDRHLVDLDRRLRGRVAAIGPLVPVEELGASLAVARGALRLADRGILPSTRVIDCRRHLTTMWLVNEELLARCIMSQTLAPFATLPERQRDRFAETLLAWLRSRGNVPETAMQLHVHPQTVRYRMNQITALLGTRLDDADARFAMEIALRAAEARGAAPASGGPVNARLVS